MGLDRIAGGRAGVDLGAGGGGGTGRRQWVGRSRGGEPWPAIAVVATIEHGGDPGVIMAAIIGEQPVVVAWSERADEEGSQVGAARQLAPGVLANDARESRAGIHRGLTGSGQALVERVRSGGGDAAEQEFTGRVQIEHSRRRRLGQRVQPGAGEILGADQLAVEVAGGQHLAPQGIDLPQMAGDAWRSGADIRRLQVAFGQGLFEVAQGNVGGDHFGNRAGLLDQTTHHNAQ